MPVRTGAREDLMTRALSSGGCGLCLYMTFCYEPIYAVSEYPLHTAKGRRWRIRFELETGIALTGRGLFIFSHLP